MKTTSAFLFAALFCAATASAQSSAGVDSVTQSVLDEGGSYSLSSSNGISSLGSSLGPTANGFLSNGVDAISGGFAGNGGGGTSAQAASSVLNLPPPLLAQQEGAYVGIPCGSSVAVSFSMPMLLSTLLNATTVTLVRDDLGQLLNSTAAYSLAYNASSNSALINASTGCWPSNHFYRVTISTVALNYQGLPLTSSVTVSFLTLADPTRANVVTSLSDFNTQVTIASGTFNAPFFVSFNLQPLTTPQTSPVNAIQTADTKAGGPVVLMREITAYDASGTPLTPSFLPGQSVLTVPYPDALTPGFVDGFGYQARASDLAFYTLDQNRGLWVRNPSSSVNTSAHTVTAPISQFGTLGLIATQDVSVSEAYAFPVPFRPHGPQAGSGAGHTGTDAEGITFVQLPAQGTVEVLNVRGERVWHTTITNGSGELVWNVQNDSGQPVASGVYLYIIKSSVDQIVGKLAIIR